MNRTSTRAAGMALLACLAAWACSGDRVRTRSAQRHAPQRAQPASVDAWAAKGMSDLAHGNPARATADFERAIRAPDFFMLSSGQRYVLLGKTAYLESRQGHARRAHTLLVRMTGYRQADAGDWLYRLDLASRLHDFGDSARCLTVIARRWPGTLHGLFPGTPLQLEHQLQRAHRDTLARGMLDALFDAGWPPEVDGADALWRDLALMHIERGDWARATRIVLRIQTPRIVLGMRVDKRFDRIRRAHPRAFDLARLLHRQIRAAQATVKAHPHRLAPIQRLQNLYLEAGRYARVLAISRRAVTQARKGEGARAYTDFANRYNWILNLRADALADQGRWTRAVREMQRAASTPERGQPNISQAINLGALLAGLDRPKAAARAIARIGGMSAYGRMQLESVRLFIAIDRHDASAIARHMAFLRAHRSIAIGTWQDALLLRGDLDQAAAVLIRRLRNPDERSDALLTVQDYPDEPETPLDRRIDTRLARIVRRPDVQAALHRVGRIEHVRFPM